MNKIDVYQIEDLFSDSMILLKDLAELETYFEENDYFQTANNDSLDTEIGCSDAEEFSDEAKFEFHISQDRMYLTADFFPPGVGKAPLEPEKVIERMVSLGIGFGIKEEIIRDSVFKCNTERATIKNVLIAEGTPPVDAIPEHYLINEDLFKQKPAMNKGQSIDYKDNSPFIVVKKDSMVAEFVPAEKGRNGSDIYGESIEYKVKRVTVYKPGKNLHREGTRVLAAVDGRFEQRNNNFYVNEVLQLNNDVDYSTGNIDFPGDIILKGLIKDGFTVSSGGSIFAANTLDATEISTESDLTCLKGIIGRKGGRVKAGGSLKARFIENCRVEAADNIILVKGAMKSEIYTSGRIDCGATGVLIGCLIYAQNGVRAGQIGSQIGIKTDIYCGIDFAVANQLKWSKQRNEELTAKLRQVRYQILKCGEIDELVTLRDKLVEGINKLNSLASSLLFKLERNDNSEIVVLGGLYPGVNIDICNVSYSVNQRMGPTRFRLDKKRGMIIATSV